MKRHKQAVISLWVALVVGLVAIFAFGGTGVLKEKKAKADDPQECASQVHYFADDVADHHYFGPPLQGDTARQRLDDKQARRCQDPALVVADGIDRAQHGVKGYEEFAGLDTDSKTVAKINELLSNRAHWKDIVQKMNDEENAGTLSQKTRSGDYKTLYMISRPGDVPLIRAASPDKTYTVLEIVLPSGQTIVYQVECGGQPRNQDFPVPPVDKPTPPTTRPPTVTTAPPTSAPPTTVPPTTPTTKPTTTTTRCTTKGCTGATVTTTPAPPTTRAPTNTTAPPNNGGHHDPGDGATNTTSPPTTEAPAATVPVTVTPSTNPPAPDF